MEDAIELVRKLSAQLEEAQAAAPEIETEASEASENLNELAENANVEKLRIEELLQNLDAIEICLTTVGEIKDRKEELLS